MKDKLKILFWTLIGNTLIALAVCCFIVPKSFMLGGTSGISLTLQAFLPLRLSILSAGVGISFFILGWCFLGWQFAAKSLLSTLIYPVILAFLEGSPITGIFAGEDTLICAICCAVLIGSGVGLVVRVGGSTGGMDIPPCILQKLYGIPVGKSLMFFDGSIILAQVFLKGTDGILYSLLILVLTSFVIDKTVVSGEQTVEIVIISKEYEDIREKILGDINCGVTMLNIETGLTGQPQKAILSVVYAKKYPEIRDAALTIDPHAFIIASDVKNVNGQGYTLARIQKEKQHT